MYGVVNCEVYGDFEEYSGSWECARISIVVLSVKWQLHHANILTKVLGRELYYQHTAFLISVSK